MTRDESLRRFAAERVMGWTRDKGSESGGIYWWETGAQSYPAFACLSDGRVLVAYKPSDLGSDWNPLESGNDAFQLLDVASKRDILFETFHFHFRHGPGGGWTASFCGIPESEVECNSGPRVITEAVCRAFGWKEEE